LVKHDRRGCLSLPFLRSAPQSLFQRFSPPSGPLSDNAHFFPLRPDRVMSDFMNVEEEVGAGLLLFSPRNCNPSDERCGPSHIRGMRNLLPPAPSVLASVDPLLLSPPSDHHSFFLLDNDADRHPLFIFFSPLSPRLPCFFFSWSRD